MSLALRHGPAPVGIGLPNMTVEAGRRVLGATGLPSVGLAFADALHLASSDACDALLAFDDRQFAKRAQKLGYVPLVQRPD